MSLRSRLAKGLLIPLLWHYLAHWWYYLVLSGTIWYIALLYFSVVWYPNDNENDELVMWLNTKSSLSIYRVPLNYEADPMGFYHIINAYEESGHIVLDAPFKVSSSWYHFSSSFWFLARKGYNCVAWTATSPRSWYRRSRYRTTCSWWRTWLASRMSWGSTWSSMAPRRGPVKGLMMMTVIRWIVVNQLFKNVGFYGLQWSSEDL